MMTKKDLKAPEAEKASTRTPRKVVNAPSAIEVPICRMAVRVIVSIDDPLIWPIVWDICTEKSTQMPMHITRKL